MIENKDPPRELFDFQYLIRLGGKFGAVPEGVRASVSPLGGSFWV